MGKQVIEYKDFSFGDFGRIEPWRAPKNSWTGTNMVVYRTGELGVRAGVRNLAPTGLSNGVVWGMGSWANVDRGMWYGQGTNVRTLDVADAGGPVSALGTVSSTPADVARAEYGDDTFIVTDNSGAYRIRSSGVTACTGSPNGRAIALLGERLIIAPTATTPATIRYSAASNFNSWPGTITVGSDDPITGLVSQRGHLVIMKYRSSFYILTGVPGINETLRPLMRDVGPASVTNLLSYAAVHADDLIWFVSQWENTPARFDGARSARVEHILTPAAGGTSLGIEPFPVGDPAALVIVQGAGPEGTAARTWLYNRGTWTKHTFGVTTVGKTASSIVGFLQDGATLSTVRKGAAIVLTDGGGAAATPNFYVWMPDIDRPGTESDPFGVSTERAGDDSSTQVSGEFSLPEYHTEDGSEFLVRKVIVDFRKWDTGGALTNHFDVNVTALRRYNAGSLESTTQSWDEDDALASTTGTLDRRVFSFGEQGLGSGYQITLENIRGIAIQRIQVEIDAQPGRWGA